MQSPMDRFGEAEELIGVLLAAAEGYHGSVVVAAALIVAERFIDASGEPAGLWQLVAERAARKLGQG